MRTALPLISAACMLSASACSHVQTPAADMSGAKHVEAAGNTTPTAQSSSAKSTGKAPMAEWPTNVVVAEPRSPQPQPGESLVKAPAAEESTERGTIEEKTLAEGETTAHGEALGRFLLTRGIEDREPMDATETFKPGERVYAFMDVANPKGEEYSLKLRWEHDEGELGEPVAVTIGTSPHWRTWSWRRAPNVPGSYRCIVETSDGQAVAELPFRVDSI